MRMASFLCLGGTEITDMARILSYGACEFFDASCPCPALDSEIYIDPITDPAPWYDPAYPESADFLGLLTQSVTLSAPGGRSVSPTYAEGSFVGGQRLPGRVVEVVGWLVARTQEAMWWGERWLTEALLNRCQTCVSDTLEVLPFCRESDDPLYDYDQDFRTLVNVGLVDGPRFVEVSDTPAYFVNTAQFQLVSSLPWLYLPKVNCITDEPISDSGPDPANCSATTPEWMEGTFVIEVTAATAVTDLVITGKVSLDGDCPVTGVADDVMPCFTYTIPEMAPDDRLLIDGMSRHAYYFDASNKFATPLLPHLEFTGPFGFPDINPCTTVCVTLEVGSGDATATVDSALRET